MHILSAEALNKPKLPGCGKCYQRMCWHSHPLRPLRSVSPKTIKNRFSGMKFAFVLTIGATSVNYLHSLCEIMLFKNDFAKKKIKQNKNWRIKLPRYTYVECISAYYIVMVFKFPETVGILRVIYSKSHATALHTRRAHKSHHHIFFFRVYSCFWPPNLRVLEFYVQANLWFTLRSVSKKK